MTDQDSQEERRFSRRSFIKGVGVVGATAVVPAGTASADTAAILSPYIQNRVQWGSFRPLSDVVTDANGAPQWIVTYSDSSFSDLQSWIESSPERTLYHHTPSKSRAVLSAPSTHIGTDTLSRLQGKGLQSLSYIESIDVNRRVARPEPLSSLAGPNAYTPPNGAGIVNRLPGGGDFDPAGIAWSEDAEVATMQDIREHIGVPDVTTTGAGIRVGVVDTGINVADDDSVFGGRVVDGYNALTDTRIDAANGDYSAIADGDGHGTFCAAEIAGNPADSAYQGIAPDADLVGVKALADDGSGSIDDIIRAVEWVADTGNVDIISMSLGSQYYSSALDDALRTILDESGVSAIVVAVGNSRMSSHWVASPADTDGVIGVSAVSLASPDEVEPAYFSCVGDDDGWSDLSSGETRGARPTIGTVGMRVRTLVPMVDGGTRVRTLSGTSMAAPVEAGGVAHLLEANNELFGEPAAVVSRVEAAAVPAKRCGVTDVGNGILDVATLLAGDEAGSQLEVRTDPAISRDAGNRAISRSWVSLLGIRQSELQ